MVNVLQIDVFLHVVTGKFNEIVRLDDRDSGSDQGHFVIWKSVHGCIQCSRQVFNDLQLLVVLGDHIVLCSDVATSCQVDPADGS